MFSLCPLTAFLTLTLHLLFIDVLAHLSGVLLRRFTLGEECGILDIKPVPLRFQLVGLLQKIKYCRWFDRQPFAMCDYLSCVESIFLV